MLPEVSILILMSYQMLCMSVFFFVSVLLCCCRLIMEPSGRCWVFSTQEGIPYYRNVHVSEGEIAVLAAVACMLYLYN